MWLITTDGFYSVANAEAHGIDAPYWEGHDLPQSFYLLVRTRDTWSMTQVVDRLKDCDVEHIKPKAGEWNGKIWTFEGTDYEHRMLIPRNAWMNYLGLACNDIKYDNFKPALYEKWCEQFGETVADRQSWAMNATWGVINRLWSRDRFIEQCGKNSNYRWKTYVDEGLAVDE